MSIILGIDPGSRTTGYGVIEATGNQYTYLTSGCIRITGEAIGERLEQIHAGLSQIIAEYQPDEAGIEQVFMHRNPGAALKLGQARGAAIVTAAQHGLSVHEYSARQVKQSVVGYGAAKKEQVGHMVRTILNLSAMPQEDAADALAIALCHYNTRQSLSKIPQVKSIRRGRLR